MNVATVQAHVNANLANLATVRPNVVNSAALVALATVASVFASVFVKSLSGWTFTLLAAGAAISAVVLLAQQARSLQALTIELPTTLTETVTTTFRTKAAEVATTTVEDKIEMPTSDEVAKAWNVVDLNNALLAHSLSTRKAHHLLDNAGRAALLQTVIILSVPFAPSPARALLVGIAGVMSLASHGALGRHLKGFDNATFALVAGTKEETRVEVGVEAEIPPAPPAPTASLARRIVSTATLGLVSSTPAASTAASSSSSAPSADSNSSLPSAATPTVSVAPSARARSAAAPSADSSSSLPSTALAEAAINTSDEHTGDQNAS